MSLVERIESLQARHAAVDSRLQDELHRPAPSPERVNRLKREKLALKDEIQRMADAQMRELA